MFAEGNRVKAKEETPYAVYLDLSGSSAAEALASKGIYAYAYDDAAEAEAAEPVKLEKTEGQQEIWQLGLTRKYEHVVFCQGQKKENKNTTGELTIDWSLQAPCYRLQGEDLTGTGSFYGLYTVYFDGSQYSEFCKNGVSVYAYDSEENSAADEPVEMKPSDKGNGIYEGDKLWNMSDQEFSDFAVDEIIKMGMIDSKADVLDTHSESVKKAYPAYFDTYEEIDTLIHWLNGIDNLYCVGRNGQHRYNNIDHSMCTSFEVVHNIVNGIRDRSNIWNVNTEKEYHEAKN